MTIYDGSGNVILDVEVDDTSYRYRAIMGDNNLTLKFALANHVEMPVGAWCEYQGEEYTLMRPEQLTMKHTRDFEYTITMESSQSLAKIWKFHNTVDKRLKFSYTAKPVEHLQMFVDNMNERDSGWTIGECIEEDEVCINYDHAYCYEALGQMADTFETEFEINHKVVSLKKLEYNKSNPLPLSYGRGNGFQPSVGRSNYGDTPPIERLYTQGGTDNIDGSKYPKNVHPTLESYSSYLLMPPNAQIGYDGEHFSDEEGWEDTNPNNRYYKVDELGYSIQRSDKELESQAEDSLDCSSIYPKRVGTISEVLQVTSGDDLFYDIVDEDIPDNLNYEDYIIEGETMTIIFQSGQLAGKEFEVKYYHNATGDSKGRRFEIVPQEIDGFTMPCENGGYYPKVGDTYAVFHCALPNEYLCEEETKSGAEWEMFRKAVQYLFDNEEQKFTFSGKLDGIWSKNDWVNIGGKIILGGYISFSDERFQSEPLLVRIVGIKDYINKPHSPELELSNCTISAGFSTTLRQMESQNVLVEDRYNDALSFTKRRFRDAQETMSMLQKAIDSFSADFTDSIYPITVQTMQMLVGDESLQFAFTDSTFENIVTHDFTYNNRTKVFSSDAGYAKHFTLGISTIANTHGENTGESYQHWRVGSYESAVLDDPDQAYYLYMWAETGAGAGMAAVAGFELTTEPQPLENEAGTMYNLLVGILNSEYEGERSFVTLYGYTEILPGRITTDMIVSNDGKTYFDLINSIICGTITFISSDGNTKNVTTIDDYLSSTLAKILYDIKDQIDGEIDTWFTTSDPRSDGPYIRMWGSDHIGDIWYNPDTDKLYYFEQYEETSSSGLRWHEVDDEDAKATFRSMYANSYDKKRVFLTTPTTPYDEGDLWIDSDESSSTYRCILVCINAKKSTESYSASDWSSERIGYDNTQTVIDGGLVTTGTLQTADDSGGICAGITGKSSDGDSPVRFWAGSSFDNRVSAPFRVLNDGSMYSTKGEVGGFNIGSDKLTATNSTGTFVLSANGFSFTSLDGESRIGMGIATGGMATGTNTALVVLDRGSVSNVQSSRGIEVAPPSITLLGARAYDLDPTYGAHAIYMETGDICGVRTRTRRINADTTLSLMDTTIFVETSGVVITLPSGMEDAVADGQIYFIKNISSGKITIQRSGSDYINFGRTSRVTSKDFVNGDLAVLIFDAANYVWHGGYMNYD